MALQKRINIILSNGFLSLKVHWSE